VANFSLADAISPLRIVSGSDFEDKVEEGEKVIIYVEDLVHRCCYLCDIDHEKFLPMKPHKNSVFEL